MKGTTKSGFEYDVPEDVFDDMELIDALADVTSGSNVLPLSVIVRKVFDEEQRKRLYDHVRDESGRVPTESIMDVILEIASESTDGKNS